MEEPSEKTRQIAIVVGFVLSAALVIYLRWFA